MTRSRSRSGRGMTLVELMVALAVLSIGLLGMMRMHVVGISSNAGARMNTQASELAKELAQGLERLDPNDPRIAPSTADTGPTAPAGFGHLVDGDGDVNLGSSTKEWSEANPVPGARLNSQIPMGYERRWTVWGLSPAPGGTVGSAIVAVSVIWREPALPRPREVVIYTQIARPAALMAGILANE